jgi:hypothetical protein
MTSRRFQIRHCARLLGALVLGSVMTICSPCRIEAQKLVDQIVVTVNGDPITHTDLIWSLALDPAAPDPSGHISSDILRQKLQAMLDQRLIEQEAFRMPQAEVAKAEVDKALADLISQFPSEARFHDRVGSVGLTSSRIDFLIKQRIQIAKFIDFRFRSFVFASEQEIKTYYDQQLAPEVQKAGAVPPALEQVKDKIADLLKQRKINDEIDRFLKDARQRADVIQLAEP